MTELEILTALERPGQPGVTFTALRISAASLEAGPRLQDCFWLRT
jgi:hypothetical protein